MRLSTSRVVAFCVFGLVSGGEVRAQSTINDCEKIQAADAYNQCLAKFGPSSKEKSLEPEKPSDIKNSSEEAAASAGRPKGAFRHRRGRKSGRQRMTISVGHRRHK